MLGKPFHAQHCGGVIGSVHQLVTPAYAACTGLPEFFLTDPPSQLEVAFLAQWQLFSHCTS